MGQGAVGGCPGAGSDAVAMAVGAVAEMRAAIEQAHVVLAGGRVAFGGAARD